MPVFAGWGAIGVAAGVGAVTAGGVYAVSSIIIGMAISAAVGAAIGGLVAAVSGGDIGTGMLYGAVGGLVVGGVAGFALVGTQTAAAGATVSGGLGAAVPAGELSAGTLASGNLLGGTTATALAPGGAVTGTESGTFSTMVGQSMAAAAPTFAGALMSDDDGDISELDQAKLDLEYAKLEKYQAAGGQGFNLAEKIRLAEKEHELTLKQLREQEKVRREPQMQAGRVRSAGSSRPLVQGPTAPQVASRGTVAPVAPKVQGPKALVGPGKVRVA